jgi:predicted deacylase
MKKILFVITVFIVAVVGFVAIKNKTPEQEVPLVPAQTGAKYDIIGTSVEGRSIESYTYGTSTQKLAFVGGVHGGYEWNSILLAYQIKDYLDANPAVIPSNLSLVIIPNLNPDGLYKVTGKEGRFTIADVSTSTAVLASGRFNANNVDLNRNFDCKWQPKSTWRSQEVSAGTSAFSEPEVAAFREFISTEKPSAVVFWHSQSNAVYASQCNNGILPVTLDIMNTYSKASLYPAVKTFDAYVTTGAADDWLASVGIPAITVELKTHEDVEFERNLAGVKAVMEYFKER